jgi:tryptophan 2,3-dioxygenase
MNQAWAVLKEPTAPNYKTVTVELEKSVQVLQLDLQQIEFVSCPGTIPLRSYYRLPRKGRN